MKILVLLLMVGSQALAKLPQLNAVLELPTIDIEKELSKDAQLTGKDRPLRIAVSTEVEDVYILGDKSSGGQWNQLIDGSWIWRVQVHAEESLSLDFGLYDFYLPPTAELRFYDAADLLVKGPFTDKKNKPHKQLWPGTIIGDTAIVELTVSNKYKSYVSFSIKNISRGFKSIWQDVDLIPKMGQQKFWSYTDNNSNLKSGSCNVDVICDEGDDWRDQISSVARYTITSTGGTFLCTGQMINNTSNDGKPLFLTANHCGFNSSNDSSINIWWNYESSQCRTPGSAASGNSISIFGFNDTQSGSTYKASFSTSDFALLELDDMPNPTHEVYYTGWDRSDVANDSAVAIHHPSGHAKRISFENDPTTITSYSSSIAGIMSHIRIADWDLGTTEGGSSGSGLWNSNKLLVGQLHGGLAACGNNSPDWYGRLFTSWEGGGSSSNRLKDWLDPGDTGLESMQGLGGCPAMTIDITHTSNSEETGVLQDFSVTVSGGASPYEYKWDINADGNTDGVDSGISATYSQRFIDNVTVEITDADGCMGNGSKAVVIESPSIELQDTGVMTQMCGNNDAFVDPGERWQIPVTMQNNGFTDAQNAYAVFTKNTASGNNNITGQDSFGNTLGSCDRQFIDISSSGTELSFLDANANDAFPAEDEGAASFSLSTSFNLYGQTINNLTFSSNGYISTHPDETGFDFDNDCPLPVVPNNSNNGSTTSARIIPLHDDLISQHLYHQHFDVCPRQSDLGTDLSCDIFMYADVDLWGTQDTVEHFNFEAILYPSVNQWVYQYDGTGFNPASTTVGLQNDGASDGASYSCNTANGINTTEAVCVYHADNQLSSGSDLDMFHLETPILTIGDIQVSQQHNGMVDFSVAQDAECGSSYNIKVQASVYDNGFNKDDSEVLSTTLGNNGSCSVSTNCSPTSSNDVSATNGLWFNANRSGNGIDMYWYETWLLYIQYTALADRSPIWYISGGGYMQNNQAYTELNKVTYNGPFLTSSQTKTKIGSSYTTLIDESNAVQTRTINGQFSAELLKTFVFGSTAAEQRTGLWYNPDEAGWGETISTQGDIEVIINYLFDNSGQPYWLLGAGGNSAVEDTNMAYFTAFCPHCPLVPVQSSDVGTVRINYDMSNQSATMEDMQIDINNGEHDSQWNRSNLPLSLITPPLED